MSQVILLGECNACLLLPEGDNEVLLSDGVFSEACGLLPMGGSCCFISLLIPQATVDSLTTQPSLTHWRTHTQTTGGILMEPARAPEISTSPARMAARLDGATVSCSVVGTPDVVYTAGEVRNVTTEGLKWNVKGEPLRVGGLISSSNIVGLACKVPVPTHRTCGISSLSLQLASI